MRLKRLTSLRSEEEGSSILEVSMILSTLMLVMIGAVDFGRAYYLANEVAGAAQAAAAYGATDPTDTTGMTNAAKYDAPDVSGLTATPSWGCECSDGTAKSASCTSAPTSCSANLVYYATVNVSATYTPLIPWKGINSSFTLSSSSTMRSASE